MRRLKLLLHVTSSAGWWGAVLAFLVLAVAGMEGSVATACRALSSMRRSADHLCSLAGERDGRCEDARARVTGATSRVSAQCPACPSP